VITSLIASRAEFENWSDIVERVTGEIAAPGDHCQKREQCIPDKEENVKGGLQCVRSAFRDKFYAFVGPEVHCACAFRACAAIDRSSGVQHASWSTKPLVDAKF
jgi:hypothetical protein